MKKRVLSWILVLAMVIGLMPAALAVETGNPDKSSVGPLSLTAPSADINQETGFAPTGEVTEDKAPQVPATVTEYLPKYENSGWEPIGGTEADLTPAADDVVTLIVVTEEKPLLQLYSAGEIAAQTASVQKHERKQVSTLNAVKNEVEKAFGNEESFEMGFTYTVASTAFSVTTEYGNKAEIAAMKGVKTVYVAPTYTRPAEDGASTFTNNASTMIGAHVLNASGYTGKGMRIAILDTGIAVNHPSFAPLSADVLEDPMTRESVEAVWDELNASQITNMLNISYHSTKIPYIFNYVSGDFNVSNSFAGSDHGTHVAGIAAGNKLSTTKAVGVAPDAQLVVMQVFQSNGGADWATIMAALEDCVRLEVDVANLSLGSAAGFTDPDNDMLDVVALFQDSDIQLVIAAGNDTHNGYSNMWGNNMSLLENPDIGLAGTPSTFSGALSVASGNNDGYEQLYFSVDGQNFGYQDTAASSATIFINQFRNQELEYVVVPGIGAPADYEGLDVTGKVALVSRGSSSFPEKQAAAQAAGAIACIVYNNALGILNMQINDGAGNIPCISISKAAGTAMIAAAGDDGVGTLKVCDADTKLFKSDRTMSDFSSWGCTPDLKLKPEISGVGGDIYSAVDPELSGSNYGYMSGTSMASPQIAGAMAVLVEFLDANYPMLTGAEQRQVAANLIMSTADPVMATDTMEYSPRLQGAGLANLVSATTTPAYLSNPDASEGRPKVEFGDDDNKTGVYEFTFTINNLSDKALTYTFDSSVLTESIVADFFIGHSPYALESKVELPEQVTVSANGTATVNAKLTLTAADKAYLDQFPNGIYVEGFVYAIPAEDAEATQGVTLVMPMLGFYGDWSDADVFDSENVDEASLYPALVFTNYAQVGTNPYFRNGKGGNEYNAFSYSNPLAEIDVGLLRNVKTMMITVTDKLTGEVYYELEGIELTKTFYSPSYGQIIPFYLSSMYEEVWDGTDTKGNALPDGTQVTYSLEAWLDDGDDVMDDEWSFDLTVDTIAPTLNNRDSLQDALRIEDDRAYLTLDIEENHHLAAVLFLASNGSVMGKFEVENVPGETYTAEFDITGFGSEFSILLADYACNETEIEVILDLGEQNNAVPEPTKLSSDRLYGCETFDGALVEGGWFSANKSDFSDPRNETFDSANRYYSAEYVNGYLIAQNANTGHLELVTPSGTYWSSQVLVQNNGAVGDQGVWVLYDMAMDYSDIGSGIYDAWGSASGTDTLYAVGWKYAGDNNNDGHDDGYNALFRIWMSRYNGSMFVDECGRITGTENGGEILTLGITTEGEMYGIGTDGFLYSIDPQSQWDDTLSTNVINASLVGATDFVNYPGFGGANVIQSMGYDHNTDTMYWYAHSQVANGAVYNNINVTYKVDLETGKCTEVGTYGPGGQTCLFVPHDIESDMFEMGVKPTGVSMSNWEMTLIENQTERLTLSWQPWNAAPQEITWSSADESIAVVDEYGFVTAVAEGETVITATTQIWNEWGGEPDENWNYPGAWESRSTTCNLTVMASESAMYGYIMGDYANPTNHMSWATYADNDLRNITILGKQYLPGYDMDGNPTDVAAMWAGGTYYNGYVYSVSVGSWEEDGVMYNGTQLYRSEVIEGATPAETVIGEPEFVGVTEGVEISAMGFDYNTGRMYCVENRAIGGLGIMDLETGKVDMLGLPNGDLSGAVYIPALCVTRDGTIVISDAIANLYTIDPDTLTTKRIYTGNGDPYSAYYEAMTYNYNTDTIYWNMCDGQGSSPLYLVMLGNNQWSGELEAKVVDLGGVSSKHGTQQTILFAIPDEEPETTHIPVESIEITNGESITGLNGGTVQLNTVTVPARPSIQTRTWTSSDENVVTVDRFGNMTYVGVGTATVTVSITNRDEAAHGGPFTDSIEVTVLESAGNLEAFLAWDMDATGYYDFWISMNDYDLRHAIANESMINTLSLRTGVYYSGYYYAYSKEGQLVRINEQKHEDFVVIGSHGLTAVDDAGNPADQIVGMAVDHAQGVVYAMTLSGQFGTVDLNTGLFTALATPANGVSALACDADGILYGAGGSAVYTIDKLTGEATHLVDLPGATMITGDCYLGEMMYSTQMTYEFSTDRLYLNATYDSKNWSESSGMYLVDLSGETVTATSLGGISLYTRSGSDIKYGQVFLSLLADIYAEDEVPVSLVNGIILSKTRTLIPVGGTSALSASVRPANAANTGITWTSSDESIATVDENGVITGVAEGTVTITATSDETGVTAVCEAVVISVSGPQSVAYTISANREALIAFNPALPAQTAQEVVTLSGGSTIRGITYGNDCLYYLVESNFSFLLYQLNLLTNQSTYLGQLGGVWTGANDIAYDAQNDLLYAVGGFYLFQYDASQLTANGGYYNYSNYQMDSDYATLAGVAVKDGAVYVMGSNYGDPQLTVYTDKYLSERLVYAKGFELNPVAGSFEMDYDAASGMFYATDTGNMIYRFDPETRYETGTELVYDYNVYDYVERNVYCFDVEAVDLLGDGIDLNGLAIDSTGKYTLTFNDGVEDEEIFADVSAYLVEGDKALNGYAGTPEREGYTFAGWVDAEGNAVTEETLVTGSATYYATWTANEYTATLVFFNGQEDATISVTFDQPMGEALVTPEREGYTFAGWFLADGVTAYTQDTLYTVDGDITLYATWTANTYTLTLNAGEDATVEPATVDVVFGEEVGELPVPVREGYTFAGWYDAEGNLVTAETVWASADQLTLTAAWTGNEYTVTLDAGKDATVEPNTITVTVGEAIGELPVPERKGYTFVGWVDADGNPVTAETVVTDPDDFTLTAVWEKNATEGDSADTGDNMPVVLLGTLLAVSAAALVVLFLLRRKFSFKG